MFKKTNILLFTLASLLFFLTSCPKETIWYLLKINNSNNQTGLKIFCNKYNPGDSMLPNNKSDFGLGLSEFYLNGGAAFRICAGEERGIRNCIENQPEKKIYVYVFDADTLDAYDYTVIRDKKKYKDRIEILYTMATNDADLKIEYP